RARCVFQISRNIKRPLMQFAHVCQNTFQNLHSRDMLRLVVFRRFDEQSQVRCVGNQPPLSRFDWVRQSFASEHFVFQNAEASPIARASSRLATESPALKVPPPIPLPLPDPTPTCGRFATPLSLPAVPTIAD